MNFNFERQLDQIGVKILHELQMDARISSRIRDDISTIISHEYSELVDVLKENRKIIKQLAPQVKKKFWNHIRALDLQLFRENPGNMREYVEQYIKTVTEQ